MKLCRDEYLPSTKFFATHIIIEKRKKLQKIFILIMTITYDIIKTLLERIGKKMEFLLNITHTHTHTHTSILLKNYSLNKFLYKNNNAAVPNGIVAFFIEK